MYGYCKAKLVQVETGIFFLDDVCVTYFYKRAQWQAQRSAARSATATATAGGGVGPQGGSGAGAQQGGGTGAGSGSGSGSQAQLDELLQSWHTREPDSDIGHCTSVRALMHLHHPAHMPKKPPAAKPAYYQTEDARSAAPRVAVAPPRLPAAPPQERQQHRHHRHHGRHLPGRHP